MLIETLLSDKRAAKHLSDAQIRVLVDGIADHSLSDEQLGALAMAIAIHGLDERERLHLTLAMRDSGRVLDWSAWTLNGPLLDKHSTGGVGDVTSLLVGPWVAACGGYVPMISGRGLGHTGGTLDKLSSIPGYSGERSVEQFQRQVAELGVAIIGQTDELAPADRRLYAARDVTGTVDSPGLIVASILSKKLAEGLNGLVLDIKFGGGAVIPQPDQANALAEALVATARAAGTAASALLTDMNQPLAKSAGNALEILEVAGLMTTPEPVGRLFELSRELAAELLCLGGLAKQPEQATAQLDHLWRAGRVAERFAAMVHAQGGPADLLDRPQAHLPVAPVQADLACEHGGTVVAIDTRALGLTVVELGGGRRRSDESIDPAVGLSNLVAIGQNLDAGQPLVRVHARTAEALEQMRPRLRQAFVIGDGPAKPPALIQRRISV